MIVSRAVFLRLFGAAAVGAALPRWTSPPEGAARFRPHIGSVFTVTGGEAKHQVVSLTNVAETTVSPGIEQYALNFSGSPRTPLAHGLYTLHHASLAAIDMFITPVGAPAGAPTYQACFSRILRTET